MLAPEVTETLRARYLGAQAQAIYLIRPDQVVAARWISADAAAIRAAVADIWEGR
jgi:3-(3-hydroxy-phenyl)propionate hydroxylase